MKLVSILGDSVSTFQGYNPRGYSVFYDASMQRVNGLSSVSDTWWDRVIRSMNARLCVNNSYSGSRVTGDCFPSAACEERLQNLGTKEAQPDYILIYAGFNDFAGGAELISSLDTYGFEDSYDQVLRTIRQTCPSARTVCATLMRTRVKGDPGWKFPEYWAGIGLEDYNNVIRWTVQENHCYLADLARTGVRYETLDGAHPTAKGHLEIAESWIKCMTDLGIL
jgi:lysophospholipase L1-like esterase